MKRANSFRIGQLIGAGFGLTLVLALLIALGLMSAYVISKRQNEVVQNRSEVESLVQQLEILSTQRSEFLRRYLASGEGNFLDLYQNHEIAFHGVFNQISPLLGISEEQQALRGVSEADAVFDSKVQEVLRLYNSSFPATARLVWETEGQVVQDNLLQATETLRQVQDTLSAEITSRARWVESVVLTVVIIFVVLALVVGVVASFFITSSIARPISSLVKTVTSLGSDLTVRSQVSGPREIAFLGETINDMAANLLASRQELQQHNDRLANELGLASQMQASFLPGVLPPLPGWELAVFWQSAREMGGDFYTQINLGHGQHGLAVGDVNGKGASAAMAGALAVGLLEAHAPAHTKPESLLAQLNDDLYARFRANRMNVACCYLILEENSFQLTVANAGCVFPYLRRNGSLNEIQVSGMPLGAWPDYRYMAESLPLCPGDLLMLSSDGLVEAKNSQGHLYGFERLQAELLKLPAGIDTQSALNRLLSSVRAFIGPTELHDDMTIIVAHFVGHTAGEI